MNEKSSFVMHAEYLEIIEMLPDDQKGRLLVALLNYSRSGELPEDLDQAGMIVFKIIKDRIDRDSEKYEKICERRREYGKKGGRPKSSESTPEDQTQEQSEEQKEESEKHKVFLDAEKKHKVFFDEKEKHTESIEKHSKAKKPDPEPDPEPDKDKYKNIKRESKEREGASASLPRAQVKRFVKPSIEQIKAYCTERGYPVDAQRFFDYYESNGWMVGKNHMKDWQAAVRNWNQRDRHGGQSGPVIKKNSFNNFPERQIDDWDLYELELLGDKRPEAEGE